jgi:hypothetical protein
MRYCGRHEYQAERKVGTKRQQIYRLETETEKLINRKMTSVLPRREQRQVVLRDKKKNLPDAGVESGRGGGSLEVQGPVLGAGEGDVTVPVESAVVGRCLWRGVDGA